MKMKSIRLSLILIAVLAVSFTGLANTITILKNQNTQNQIDQAQPGDTLLFEAGDHDRIDIHSIVSSECNPLVLMSLDPNNPARIYEPSLSTDRSLHIFESEYVVVDNLIIEGALYGVDVQHSVHIVVKNCEVKNTGQEGTKTRDRSRHIDWINNKIHDTGTRPNFSGYGECMYIGTGSYANSMFSDADSTAFVWIENNEVYNCGNGEAVELKPWVRNSTVKGNKIYNIAPGTSYQTNEGALVAWGSRDKPGNNWIENNNIDNITWGETGGSGLVSFGGGNYFINNTVGNCEEAAIYFNGYLDFGFYVYDWNNTINNTTGDDYKGLNNLDDLRQQDPGISNPHTPQSWCGNAVVICPNPDLGEDFDWCNETTHTLTATSNNPDYSYAWFVDGEPINETSRMLDVTGPGEYSVTVSAEECADISDMITISSDLIPDVIGDTICAAGEATLSATGMNDISWYDAAANGNILETGEIFMPIISSDTTYYVQAGEAQTQYIVGRTEMNNNWDGGSYAERKIKFVIDQSLTIDAVTVIAQDAQTAHARILASDNSTVLHDISQSINAGIQKIKINRTLQPGTYFMDAEGSTGTLKYENESADPAVNHAAYGIDGVIAFDAEPFFEATSNPRWRYFYNWEISVGSACARVPVEAIINPNKDGCLVTHVNKENVNEFDIYPNPTSGIVHFTSESDYQIIDALGYIIQEGTGISTDLSDAPSGLYILKTHGVDTISTLPIVKQ